MQARSILKGGAMINEAAGFIAEYAQRKRLAKLGFFTPTSELSALKAEIFGIIDAELDKIQLEKINRGSHGR